MRKNYTKENPLRVFTTFSGYDSQCLSLDYLHESYPDFCYTLVGWSEIDSSAITAHNALYPQYSHLNYGDVSKIDWNSLDDFDLLTYSSPCQDFSKAGKHAGGEEGSGTRSSLLWNIRDAIEAKHPKFLLLENVSNLVSKQFIEVFSKWMQMLKEYGYESFYKVVNSKLHGSAQNRERVFMISILQNSPEIPETYKFPKGTDSPTVFLDSVKEKSPDKSLYLPKDKIKEWIVQNQDMISRIISDRNKEPNKKDMLTKQQNIETPAVQEEHSKKRASKKAAVVSFDLIGENIKKKPAETAKAPKKNVIINESVTRPYEMGRCIKRIPTPTCTGNVAPTLMATGYAHADYKNFYSVGHFPKLGVFEIWRKPPTEEKDV